MTSRRITRRQFLTGTGTALAGMALACRMGQGRGTGLAPPTQITTDAGAPSTPTLSPSPRPTAPADLAADLVLRNGKILTIDASDTVAQAIAIKDGRIQAVGSDAEIAAFVGESTQSVSLDGLTVTPGLIDAHNHFRVTGLMQSYYVPLLPPDVVTTQDLQAKLAEIIAQTPEGTWINGYYLFVQGIGMPTRHDLDPVSPNHPVWITQQGGHYGSANSRALEVAGITGATPDPPGGMIGRDSRGEPNGIFYNHRAMDLVRLHAPPQTQEMVRDSILSTQDLFATCGVTSFQDNNVRGVDMVRSYMDAAREGVMSLRGAAYYTLEWPGDLDRALNEMDTYADDYMRFAGYKFLLDGQLTMAYCHEPHNGERWDMPTWDPMRFKDAVRALHDSGYQICVHCAGDAAVDLTLDAYEAAMNANPRPDPRHRIEHAIFTRASSTQRMKDLGVVVCTQPQFIRLAGDGYADLMGEARAKRAIVTREWLDNGVVVALSSDCPSTPWYTPHATLIGAVARLTYSNQTYEADQAMTLQEALRAHTMGSAYAAHEENEKGSLDVGKMGDLVVWDTDLTQASIQDLWSMVAEMTVVGGEIVHDTGKLAVKRARDLA